MEEKAVVIYVHKVCTKFTKQNSSISFLQFVFSFLQNTTDYESRRLCNVTVISNPMEEVKGNKKTVSIIWIYDK